jgi:phosphoribosylformimino-5-aminoimidazole carboxamide ribotide isomerase
MIIFPAIDLRQGQVVRLWQGDPGRQIIYDADPAGVARRWAGQGAEWLHVVNLDGALSASDSDDARSDASLINLQRLGEIRAATQLSIQFGGGVRSLADIERALALGATRVVLGTVAVRNPDLVGEAVARFGAARIVVGIDARDGLVATEGWRRASTLDALEVARRVREQGVTRVVYTDIARDGTKTGVNAAATAGLAQASGLSVIASGGVAGLADITELLQLAAVGIEGVIAGQALYTGALDLREAVRVGRGQC